MQKAMIRLCILGCVLGALLVPASAFCGSTSGQYSCQAITLPGPVHLACAVGGGMAYTPKNHDTRFSGSDFSQSCLVNAGVTCADKANGAKSNPGDASHSCCSCALYAKYCAGKSGFVTHPPAAGSDHSLVMPATPCTGVENWDNSDGGNGCPGESIWDVAHTELVNAKRDALWGMSINPVSRRGQHQMHVHIAQVDTTLMKSIVDGFNAPSSLFYVDCSLSGNSHGKSRLEGCKYSASKCTNCPEVHIKHQHTNPSGAHPFEVAYGSMPSNSNPNALKASTLVLRLPNKVATDTWAVVINPYGPAECFFAKKAGSDLLTACPQ